MIEDAARLRGYALSVARRSGLRDEDAEDAAQEAVLEAWRTRERAETRAHATMVVRYSVAAFARRRRQERAELDRRTLPDGTLEDFDPADPSGYLARSISSPSPRRARTAAEVRALPERDRLHVLLRYYEDRSQKETARVMRITPSAVSNRWTTTIRPRLHEALSDLVAPRLAS